MGEPSTIAVVELLLKVLDLVGKLVGYKREQRRKVFESVFEPAFNDLRKVHSDYLQMFRALQKVVPPTYARSQVTYAKRMRNAAEQLRDMRLEFAPVRTELRQLAENLILQKLDPHASRFADALLEYFPDGSLRDPSQPRTQTFWKSASANMLDRIAEDAEALEEHDISQLIEDTIAAHEKAWSEVCDAYQGMKLEIVV